MIDAVDDGEVDVVGRRRDQHALGSSLEMCRSLLLAGKQPGTFKRDVDAEILPGKLRRVANSQHLDRADSALDGVALDGDLAGKAAMNGVEAQEVRVGLRRREVVDRHHSDVLALRLNNGAQDIAPDAAESVN